MRAKFPLLGMYLLDQKYYVILYFLSCFCGAGLFMFEWKRNVGIIDLGTMFYYIVLSLLLLITWLVVNYIRMKPYYLSLSKAIKVDDPLHAIQIIQDERSHEQKLVKKLLLNQQAMYLSRLDKLKRKSEIQYHFILQWVHQMKTPVSVINMLMQQGQERAKHRELMTTMEQKELYSSVEEEAERLDSGLEMMIHSARVEKLELDLHVKSVPLHDITRDIINRYKRSFIQYHIFPRIEGEAIAQTDSKWFSFVMNQIISNSIKYSKSKSGNKSLLVTFHKHDNTAIVKISDQGIGIAPSDIKRVFDPFFTGENGRKTGESTGMGLYLAKEVCQRLGHQIKVESEQGEGTVFTLTIQQTGIHHFI